MIKFILYYILVVILSALTATVLSSTTLFIISGILKLFK